MKTKLTNLKGCKRLIEIEVLTDEVERKFEEIYKEIGRVAAIPGFRVGKAPQDIIEQKYKIKAEQEVLKDLVGNSYDKAIKELKIIPVELPQIRDVRLERGKPLRYKAELDIQPGIKIKKYKGLRINKNKVEMGGSEVEKALLDLQNAHAKFISTDERSVVNDDYVICDLMCSSDGKQLFKKEAMWLFVNDQMGVKELHQGIIGMKIGEEKEVLAKLPKNYPDKNLAEKEVMFKVTIKHIKEKKLPQLDDGFAKDLGKSNIQELKDTIKKDLVKRAEISANQNMRDQIIDQLLKNSSFDIPESMVSRQLENLVSDTKERLRSEGLKEEDISSNTKEIEDKLRPQAVNHVKLYFLLSEIAHLEDIKVEPSEVDKTIEFMAIQFKKDKKKLLEEYEEKNLLQHIIGQIREEKTMDFLLREGDITMKE